MENEKTRVIQDYDKLSNDLKEQIKLVFPDGYSQHLIEFRTVRDEKVIALPFETFDKIYMIRMTVSRADEIIENDSDYDDDGNLKEYIREKYEDDHADVDYLDENDNYEEFSE